jgi:hypothetical protein
MAGAEQLPAQGCRFREVQAAAERFKIDVHENSIMERNSSNKIPRSAPSYVAGRAQP